MQIELTKRITDALNHINENERMISKILDVSEALNGGSVINLTPPYNKSVYDAVKQWYIQEHSSDWKHPEEIHGFFENHIMLPRIMTKESIHPYFKIRWEEYEEGGVRYGVRGLSEGSIGLLSPYHFNVLKNDAKLNSYVLLSNVYYPIMSINDFEYPVTVFDTDLIENRSCDLYGNVLIIGDYCWFATYLALHNRNVKSITIAEENEDILSFYKKYMLDKFKTDKIKIIQSNPLEHIKNHRNSYSCVYIDKIAPSSFNLEQYKDTLRFEKEINGLNNKINIININDDLILYSAQCMLLKYLSASAGSENYKNYFKNIAPDFWNLFENIDEKISLPGELDYVLDLKNVKRYIEKNL